MDSKYIDIEGLKIALLGIKRVIGGAVKTEVAAMKSDVMLGIARSPETTATKNDIIDVSATVNALIDVLVSRGMIDPEEVSKRKKELLSGSSPSLNVTADGDSTPKINTPGLEDPEVERP